jgi:hypothetical protein
MIGFAKHMKNFSLNFLSLQTKHGLPHEVVRLTTPCLCQRRSASNAFSTWHIKKPYQNARGG